VKRDLILLYLIILSIIIGGCASTNMTSVKDPSYSTKQFHKILVIAPFNDLEERNKAETAFIERLSKYNVEAIPSINIFIPTRKYNDNEIKKILSDNNFDAVLSVILTDAWTKQLYVQSSSTYGQGNVGGNIITNSPNMATLSGSINYSSNTQTIGGVISKPRVKYDIRLYDATTGDTAWLSTSLTKGNAFAKFDTLINSLADTTVEKLKNDGLLK